MFPVLLSIGNITVYSYGFFVFLGYVACSSWILFDAKRKGIELAAVLDLLFYCSLAGLIGGRVFFVILYWDHFANDLLGIFRIWQGGMVYYGAFVFALGAGAFYLLATKRRVLPWADLLAPGLALGQSLGRVGCLAAGCCYGKPLDAAWAITFTNPYSLARPEGVPLHPTQLYASGALLLLFALLLFIRRSLSYSGQCFCIYLFFHAVIRLTIEHFRGDYLGNGPFGVLSMTQFVAILMLLGAFLLWTMMARRSQTE